LFVEDCQYVSEMMGRIIASRFPNVTIHIAGNGKIGLDLFKEHLPDLIITDINMPEMDGIQMATEIKSVKNDARFIVLTGNMEKEIFDKFSKIGYEDFMIKPIEFNRLFAAIEKCIAEFMLGSISFSGAGRVLNHSMGTSGSPLTQQHDGCLSPIPSSIRTKRNTNFKF
jgi:YesN/AraC family two-component response regulator